MSDLMKTLALSASGMQAQSTRLRHVSENIANTDTPGYHRKTASFEAVLQGGNRTGEVRAGDVKLDRSELNRVYDPSHPLADETGHIQGSNVDLVVEIADAREAQRSYEANLKMFDQARQMSSALLELLRK
ncbi:flagellar basal body rod protein FlgC [Falsihalocynthiibacter sp. SS001]|uniref:flagellar basal body rod protein FlgC n=1 Tax=Falsihalocynthiibacter sp. SS001 TaxID=3349698 RepID=UPI0036D43D64